MTFWNGETYQIVKAMKATGNQPGVIAAWKDQIARWAAALPDDRDAQAIRSWLPLWQVRPFYTAAELAPIWPALAIAIGASATWPKVLKSAGRLAHELDYAGLPYIETGEKRYYIVEQIHLWKTASKEEIDNALALHE